MKLSLAAPVIISLLYATGCASTGQSQADRHASQKQTISKWHNCLDRNLTEFDNDEASPQTVINSTLVACQGHKEDVIATFPAHLEESLEDLLKNQAYEVGIEQIAARRGLFATRAQSAYRSLLLENTQEE